MKNQQHPIKWKNKINKAVWRGSPTGGVMFDRLISGKPPISPRGMMCKFSSTKKGKELLDFAFSTNLPSNAISISEKLPCKMSFDEKMSLGEQESKYKFVLDLTGNGWSSRFLYLLALNMVVVKEMSNPYTDFCYDMSVEGVDFIGFVNTSNLISNIEYLQRNDDYSTQIINQSNRFVNMYCSKDSQLCYWNILLNEYYKLQQFKVDTPHKNAIKINKSYYDTNVTMIEFFFIFFYISWILTFQCCIYLYCCGKIGHLDCYRKMKWIQCYHIFLIVCSVVLIFFFAFTFVLL